MEWFYKISYCNCVISVSPKGFPTSRDAEIEAEIIIAKMSSVSGSLYSYAVELGELQL